MIAALFIGCTLFARNSLKGQPKLQQRLVKLPIYCGLLSDVRSAPPSGMGLVSVHLITRRVSNNTVLALRHHSHQNPLRHPVQHGSLDAVDEGHDLWLAGGDAVEGVVAVWDRPGCRLKMGGQAERGDWSWLTGRA